MIAYEFMHFCYVSMFTQLRIIYLFKQDSNDAYSYLLVPHKSLRKKYCVPKSVLLKHMEDEYLQRKVINGFTS